VVGEGEVARTVWVECDMCAGEGRREYCRVHRWGHYDAYEEFYEAACEHCGGEGAVEVEE